MIDGHVHLERGPYTIEWLERFVDAARQRGINSLYLLEHSHRFIESRSIYSDINPDSYFGKWLETRLKVPLKEYINFIEIARTLKYPIKIQFGLEVCYFEQHEEEIHKLTRCYPFDFITGSVHYIDGWAFDHKPEHWYGRDVDATYGRYYEIMGNLIKSRLFDILAHPDSIKCFGNYPSGDLTETYQKIAGLLVKSGVKAEQSAGLHLNYKHSRLGMNETMLQIFQNAGVEIITASDAHRPEDVGMYIKEIEQTLKNTF
ncbi:PHP domain-containing protein [Desulfosporosinus sp. PR]|uniref:PHP domain-containing protein n=1 Tax=Candidatus Desulfosporosinus nitrosoreducens TaxID=3401928 RepID=UPI0027EDFFD8|nr:PHP domain-containing protein [Desulfosporosinus sp. PR]MDQ7094459.1 PHP domain-containing protein [Desulfosporosinus sp. PR]